MNSTKISIIANFVGRIWSTFLGILFVPLYLKYLSIEFYGIIGIFTSVQVILTLLDSGLSPTLTREMARLSTFPEKAQEMRNLARTLEIPFWIIGVIVTVICLGLSPFLAQYWIKSETLSVELITESLILISIGFGFQWLTGFYSSGLIGLQKQVKLNLLNVIFGTLRSVGALLVLAYISPTIKGFLLWQAIIYFLNAITIFFAFWKSMPKTGHKTEFQSVLLKNVWRYALGMSGIALVSIILSQVDKVILSKMLTLEYFGYYSLATTLAGTGIGMIVSSIASVYFPKFSQAVAKDDEKELGIIYHQGSQVLSVFLIPITLIIAFFSTEILQIWTRDSKIVENTWLLLLIIAIGTGINGIMHMPYNMQLANGITKLAFWKNIFAIIVLIPLMIFATQHYGAVGAAGIWIILNLFYFVAEVPIMHSFLLKGEMKNWYLKDVVLPSVIAVLIFGSGKLLLPQNLSNFWTISFIIFVSAIVFVSVSVCLPFVRNSFLHQIRRVQSV